MPNYNYNCSVLIAFCKLFCKSFPAPNTINTIFTSKCYQVLQPNAFGECVTLKKKNNKEFIKLDAHGVFMEKFCNLIKFEPLVHLKKCDPTKLNNCIE